MGIKNNEKFIIDGEFELVERFTSFGSVEFFNFLRDGVAAGGGDFFWADVCALIKRDFRGYLFNQGITEQYHEMVFNKVFLAVRHAIPCFIRQSASHTVGQRNAWLVEIVKTKTKEYFRDNANFHKKSGHVSITDIELPYVDRKIEKVVDAGVNSEINRLIKFVCNIDTTPDKIIAFFFNKVIFFLRSNKFNGYPSMLSKMYNGKSLSELAVFMKHELITELGFKIPESCFKGLDDKLAAVRADGTVMYDCEFKLTAREITDSSSWILKKTRNSKEIIIGGFAE